MYNLNDASVLQTRVLLIDPSIKQYSTDHLPYMMVALIMLFIFGICPAFFLCLYPTRVFRRVMHCCSPRRRLALDMFMETIQGCYRDGLNGDTDYRMIPAVSMFIIVLYVLYYLFFPMTLFNGTTFIGGTILFIVIALLLCYLKPCKSSLMNLSLSFHFAMLALSFAVVFLWTQNYFIHTSTLILAYIVIISLPHYVVIFGLLYKLLSQFDSFKKCVQCLTRQRRLFQSGSNVELSLPDRLENSTRYQTF